MTQSDEATREIQAPCEPATTLRAAVLSIDATLALAGTRYGDIVTLDDEGMPHDPAFSGLTPGKEREQLAWPGNAACSSISTPCRAGSGGRFSGQRPQVRHRVPVGNRADLPKHADRHRGVEVGSFFLTERADGEAFTAENEEVLTPFTCRAVLAVANQCTRCSQRRAPQGPGNFWLETADLSLFPCSRPAVISVIQGRSGTWPPFQAGIFTRPRVRSKPCRAGSASIRLHQRPARSTAS